LVAGSHIVMITSATATYPIGSILLPTKDQGLATARPGALVCGILVGDSGSAPNLLLPSVPLMQQNTSIVIPPINGTKPISSHHPERSMSCNLLTSTANVGSTMANEVRFAIGVAGSALPDWLITSTMAIEKPIKN
jgi:hypothetical protein